MNNTIRSITFGSRQIKRVTLLNGQVYQIMDTKQVDLENIYFINQQAAREVYHKKEEEVYNDDQV